MRRTRREVLAVGGLSMAMGGVAGCLDAPAQGGEDTEAAGEGNGGHQPSVYASFFTLYDFARNVAGKNASIENAVPAEQHGHGWEPPTTLLPDILESDAFLYLDVDGFQPWAETAAATIDAEYADDVALIDVLEGIELLEYGDHGHSHDHDDGHDHSDDSDEANSDLDADVAEIVLVDRETDEEVADAHHDHWHGSLPPIQLGEHVSLGATFTDADGTEFPLEDGPYTFDARLEDDSSTDIVEIDSHGDHVHLRGEGVGAVSVVFRLVSGDGDEAAWEAPPLEARVEDADGAGDEGTEEEDDHGHSHGDDDGHDHSHSHGEYDAKFFSDPVLAKRGVENIRDGLIELDPDNETRYEENAADYVERLEDLHDRFEAALADREHDAVVLAGHDSFQYLGARYDFEIHTPMGLSPDVEPSSNEIADTLAFVEDHGIEYVLWDYFDGDRLAKAIVEESETATEAIMVSPAESVVESWDDDGYGDYLGQMEEITLPALEKALGAQ